MFLVLRVSATSTPWQEVIEGMIPYYLLYLLLILVWYFLDYHMRVVLQALMQEDEGISRQLSVL
jgi:hypothetical protein